jgi:putative ABC transport system permease protein
MNEQLIDLTLWQLLAAYLFIVMLLAIAKWKGIRREREIFLSTVRMTLQLILAGYVLVYIFANSHPMITVLWVGFMLGFAVHTVFNRAGKNLSSGLKRIIVFSMITGIAASLAYFIFAVLNLTPWYEPRYVIPIAGMVIGNSMTGISLGVTTLIDGMKANRAKIEAALMMGATPKAAAASIGRKAFDAAMLPTINSMLGMGIVFLPGMMAGQILSGTSPHLAVEYQIAIMLGIVGSTSLTVILFVQLACRSFFNRRAQLIEMNQ